MPPGGVQPPRGRSGMAIASLVLGLVGIPLCWCFIPSILAVVFGAIGLNQTKQQPGLGGRGMAVAGLVLGVAVIVLAIVLVVIVDRDARVELG